MPNLMRSAESHVKLALPELPASLRSGGENQPLEYPHLYQIQAGDWRISYAVENNRLAILVLEVLNADGSSSSDPVRETINKKMKVKLLDWPEGSGQSQLPPEELTKKLKIKWLDMAEEGAQLSQPPAATGRIKFKGSEPTTPLAQVSTGRHRITLLDAGEAVVEDDPQPAEAPGSESAADRKTTPLDAPSM